MLIWLKAKLVTIIIGLVATTTIVGTATVVAAKNHVGPLASNGLFTSVAGDHHGSSTSNNQGDDNKNGNTDDQQLVGVIRSADLTAKSLVLLPDGQTITVTISFDTKTNIEQEHGALATGIRVQVEVILRSDKTLYATEIHTIGPNTGQHNDQEDQKILGTVQSVNTGAQTFTLLADGQSAAMTIAFDAKTNIEHESGDDKGAGTLTAGARVLVEVVQRADKSLYATEIKFNGTNGDNGNGGPSGGDNHGTPEPGDDHHGTPSPTTTPEPGDDHGGNGGGHDDPTPHP